MTLDYVLHNQTEYGRFLTDIYDKLANKIADGFFHDDFLKEYYDKYLNSDSVFVDVGAYIGSHTVYCSKKCKKVYSFEPTRRTFFQLCANLLVNNITNCQPFNIGLSDKESYQSPNSECGNAQRIYEFPASICYSAGNSGDICFKTLDSFNLEQVNFIKIDAEDMDFKVIKGSLQTINKFHPIISFETVEKELNKYTELLTSLKYEIKQMSPNDYIAL